MLTFAEFKQRSCTEKIPYARRGIAWAEAQRLGEGNQVYECLFHKHYHVGRPASKQIIRRMLLKLLVFREVERKRRHHRRMRFLNRPGARRQHFNYRAA